MENLGFVPLTLSGPRDVPGLEIRELSREDLRSIPELNRRIFDEDRIINTFERADLVVLEALVDGEPAGFKIGYRENRFAFYSAKGGVLSGFRRRGVARALLAEMMAIARRKGYRRFTFDTFPNLHPGMTIMALRLGFRIVRADYNSVYREYRVRFEMPIGEGAATAEPPVDQNSA
ncbi:MAG: GNAT family N-acetyltransferase [Rhodothermales bacterium]|nr:GNAT family N-acetyltransferase [Rhodothermales bacterium]